MHSYRCEKCLAEFSLYIKKKKVVCDCGYDAVRIDEDSCIEKITVGGFKNEAKRDSE